MQTHTTNRYRVLFKKKKSNYGVTTTEQRCVSKTEPHVNDPGNWFVFILCVPSSAINRVFVNSLDVRRNKQIGLKKKDGNKPIIPLSSDEVDKKTSVHVQDGDGDANLLVNTESSKSC